MGFLRLSKEPNLKLTNNINTKRLIGASYMMACEEKIFSFPIIYGLVAHIQWPLNLTTNLENGHRSDCKMKTRDGMFGINILNLSCHEYV
jgi:hypothetical protein